MTCRACGSPLEREYFLPLCDPCLKARSEVEEIPGLHRVQRRYRIFKVVAPLTALACYAGVYAYGIKEPLLLISIGLAWLNGTLYSVAIVDGIWRRPRI